MIPESFLQFIWEQGLFNRSAQKGNEGENIEVISTGTRNSDSGPDFFNAQIKINEIIWAGNIEIHSETADWYRHKHHLDPAYNNVILHVVPQKSSAVLTQAGTSPHHFELIYDPEVFENFDALQKKYKWIPCENRIRRVNPELIQLYLPGMAVKRMEYRFKRLLEIQHSNHNSREETLYHSLARAFGFKTNALPFEILSRSVPLKFIHQLGGNVLQTEALLLGQSGLLPAEDNRNEYVTSLKKEYKHLRNRFRLTPMQASVWKFCRTRPGNFPTLRIVQFAALIREHPGLLSKVLETVQLNDFYPIFNVRPSDYWDKRYTFGPETTTRMNQLGVQSVQNIIINSIAPVLFGYGADRQEQEYKDRALNYLEMLPPEDNSVVRNWAKLGIKASDALQSQSLIHLKDRYCQARLCLNCPIGVKMIRQTGIK